MRILVNSTPLIALCKIGMLDILKDIYHEVIIPQAVFDEVMVKKDSVCRQIEQASEWLHVEQVKETVDRRLYSARLHAGEVEVMILAQHEPQADLVIIDDNAAKKTAKYLGLTVTGTLGVLIEAKNQGIISSIAQAIAGLRKNGIYISDKVVHMALEAANEEVLP